MMRLAMLAVPGRRVLPSKGALGSRYTALALPRSPTCVPTYNAPSLPSAPLRGISTLTRKPWAQDRQGERQGGSQRSPYSQEASPPSPNPPSSLSRLAPLLLDFCLGLLLGYAAYKAFRYFNPLPRNNEAQQIADKLEEAQQLNSTNIDQFIESDEGRTVLHNLMEEFQISEQVGKWFVRVMYGGDPQIDSEPIREEIVKFLVEYGEKYPISIDIPPENAGVLESPEGVKLLLSGHHSISPLASLQPYSLLPQENVFQMDHPLDPSLEVQVRTVWRIPSTDDVLEFHNKYISAMTFNRNLRGSIEALVQMKREDLTEEGLRRVEEELLNEAKKSLKAVHIETFQLEVLPKEPQKKE